MELYDIAITSGDDEIVIGLEPAQKGFITAITVKLDTVDDNVSDKSASMLAKIDIKGRMEEEITPQLIKLYDWAREESQAKCYRKLVIHIKDDSFKIRRTFEFENVFVVDYFEEYHSDGENDGENKKPSQFILSLTQKKNMLSSIKNY